MHNVSKKFDSVASLRSALWHEFGDTIPDEGEFNVGYFEGKQHTKKWLISSQDLDAYFEGKRNLWCDGKEPDESYEEKTTRKKPRRESKRSDREDKLEDVFQQLRKKHSSEYSGPQLRLWGGSGHA